ncbi:hypothetical protein Catovirus_1_890 [Catovirus CTV1]|uniref:Uncharacterized protein n=1 Tax=Catovirus CTV1 TaxID=1977631 RepID=A0A1V0SAT4_9VIRU|nr:hypothetical protein Catovirus_1_890 [Catovirus CTV1]
MDTYSYTGNNVPLDVNSAILYAIKQLKEYDDNLEKGILLPKSPYHDFIVMETSDGKIIEIPYDVQQEAISKWEIIKVEMLYEKEKKQLENNIINLSKQLENDIVENFESNSGSNYILFLLIGAIIVVTIYLYQKKN